MPRDSCRGNLPKVTFTDAWSTIECKNHPTNMYEVRLQQGNLWEEASQSMQHFSYQFSTTIGTYFTYTESSYKQSLFCHIVAIYVCVYQQAVAAKKSSKFPCKSVWEPFLRQCSIYLHPSICWFMVLWRVARKWRERSRCSPMCTGCVELELHQPIHRPLTVDIMGMAFKF